MEDLPRSRQLLLLFSSPERALYYTVPVLLGRATFVSTLACQSNDMLASTRTATIWQTSRYKDIKSDFFQNIQLEFIVTGSVLKDIRHSDKVNFFYDPNFFLYNF